MSRAGTARSTSSWPTSRRARDAHTAPPEMRRLVGAPASTVGARGERLPPRLSPASAEEGAQQRSLQVVLGALFLPLPLAGEVDARSAADGGSLVTGTVGEARSS